MSENRKGSRMKNHLIAMSIFSVGICFLIGSLLLSNSFREEKTNTKKESQHELLTISELADYLGITVEEVQTLTEVEEGLGVTSSYIPHIKMEKTNYYPKRAIDKWLLDTELTVVP